MLRLNKFTDYAIVILTRMDTRRGEVWTAAALARDTGLAQTTIAKTLKLLTKSNILNSHRGSAGGHSLQLDLEDLSVADVIRAIEGPIALTSCVDEGDKGCDIQCLCPMRSNWKRVNDALSDALGQISIAEMATPNIPIFVPQIGEKQAPELQA